MGAFSYSIAVIKATVILAFALFLPHICVWSGFRSPAQEDHQSPTVFRSSLENIASLSLGSEDFSPIKGSIALVTNTAAKDSSGRTTLDVLLSRGFPLKKIFVSDKALGKNILQGKSSKSFSMVPFMTKKGRAVLNKDLLVGIDYMLVDLQNGGMRYDGSHAMLLDLMKTACLYRKKCVVLDRPNLLGWCMEGFSSHLPVRYGMTIGEIARYYNKYVLGNKLDLTVIPMSNYDRCVEAGSASTDFLGQFKNIDSWYGYSFLGLLSNVAPLDTGIGTEKAYQCVLLPDSIKFPKQKWHELGVLLKELGVESKGYRYYSASKKQYCSGLRVHVQDINHFSSVKTLFAVLTFFKQNGVPLKFSSAFDKALGSHSFRRCVQGGVAYAEVASKMNDEVKKFFNKACSCFLYKPFPKIMHA
jgi:uncharacterized protein YbbC (DUF1343 family)